MSAKSTAEGSVGEELNSENYCGFCPVLFGFAKEILTGVREEVSQWFGISIPQRAAKTETLVESSAVDSPSFKKSISKLGREQIIDNGTRFGGAIKHDRLSSLDQQIVQYKHQGGKDNDSHHDTGKYHWSGGSETCLQLRRGINVKKVTALSIFWLRCLEGSDVLVHAQLVKGRIMSIVRILKSWKGPVNLVGKGFVAVIGNNDLNGGCPLW